MMTEEDYERQERQMAIDCAVQEYARKMVSVGYFHVEFPGGESTTASFYSANGGLVSYYKTDGEDADWAIKKCKDEALAIYELEAYKAFGIR